MFRIVENPGNGRLNNLNDRVLNVLNCPINASSGFQGFRLCHGSDGQSLYLTAKARARSQCRLVQLVFLVDKMALRQVFLQAPLFSLVSAVPAKAHMLEPFVNTPPHPTPNKPRLFSLVPP